MDAEEVVCSMQPHCQLPKVELPPNLEELALFKFDQLLLQGKLLYRHSEPERVDDHDSGEI